AHNPSINRLNNLRSWFERPLRCSARNRSTSLVSNSPDTELPSTIRQNSLSKLPRNHSASGTEKPILFRYSTEGGIWGRERFKIILPCCPRILRLRGSLRPNSIIRWSSQGARPSSENAIVVRSDFTRMSLGSHVSKSTACICERGSVSRYFTNRL